MISEERLRLAAQEAGRAIAASLPEPEDCQAEFSPSFERKMKKLIWRADHRGLCLGLKRAACFFLALLLSGGVFLTVNAEARELVFGWISQRAEDAQRYFHQGEPTDSADIVRYHLDVPEGYWLDSVMDDEAFAEEFYVNKEGLYIDFAYYYVTENSVSELYIMDAEAEKKRVSVNGMPADLYVSYEEDANNTIVWTDTETGARITVTAFVDEDALLDLAERVVPEK